MTPLISPFVNNPLQNHEFRHCVAWTLFIVNDERLSESVFFSPENTFFGSYDIAGWKKYQ